MSPSAIVVGGGFAGLTAAHYLRKNGWRVQLVEANDRVGGRVATVRRDGYMLDTGATQMSSGYGEYLALCAELGWTDQMSRSSPDIGLLRDGRIHVIDGRKAMSGPLSPVLSLRSKLRMLATVKDYLGMKPPIDVLDVSASRAWDVESVEQYALRRLNHEIYEILVDPLVRCYVMNGARDVSALEWFSTLRNLSGQTLLSLDGGNDRLPRRLAEGLDILYSTRALSVTKTAQGVSLQCRDVGGRELQLSADACVLATRLNETLAIHPPAREAAGALAHSLRYNRAWVVQLGYRRRPASTITGLLLPTRESPDVSLLWLEHNKNPDRAPPNHALFSVYSDEACNDANLALSDEALTALASSFVERLFPEIKGHQDLVQITRWPLAIPNPAPGYYQAIHAMKQRLDPSDRVQLAGDYFTCVGQNSAIHYGRLAAHKLMRLAV